MKIRRKLRHARPGTFRIVILTLITMLFVVLAFCTVYLVSTIQHISETIPDISNAQLFKGAQNSRIYANDGKTVLADLQIENRQPVDSLNDISPNLIKATISIEDARFYEHGGVDVFGLIRAAGVILFQGSTQGGSTITMQLARNTILSKEAQTISIERKIAEIMIATRMEEVYSKDEILLMYLNTINYGDGCYGIKAAAEHYFSKAPADLTLSESATLAGIPQSPTNLSPTANYNGCKNRRDTVLGRMLDDHVITQAEFNEAVAEPINLNITNKELTNNFKYPYFTNYIRDLLMEKYTTAEIFEGGMQVYTTLDIKHQEANQAGCDSQNNKIEKGAECAAVTVDPSNGFVTSMVGGADYQKNQFNIAAQKGRPTGSSFKTFTLVTSIEQKMNPYSTMINCSSPLTMNGSQIRNFGGASYGTRSVQSATAISSNTGYCRLQEKCGTQNVIDTARKLGIKNADLPNVPTLTLGVADITPLEMASAYATIASGGIYHEPVAITKIQTAQGDVLFEYDAEKDGVGERVITPEVAGAATEVLETVFTSGTATSAQLTNGQPVAGKTGTSEDYRDHTLVGYTPRLVLATWIGKRDYTSTSSAVSCNALFKNIMSAICQGEPIQDFPEVADPEYSYGSNNNQQYRYNSSNDLSNAPNVVGMSESAARSALSNYSLTIYRINSDSVPKGCVVSQSVSGGRVVLYISNGSL